MYASMNANMKLNLTFLFIINLSRFLLHGHFMDFINVQDFNQKKRRREMFV